MLKKNTLLIILSGIVLLCCLPEIKAVSGNNVNPAIVNRIGASLQGSGIKPNDGVYNVSDFGAVGDGIKLNTLAFQAAIDACTKDGGGVVYVPAGDFLTGTIELKSNITLRLSPSARILGSKNKDDYVRGNGIPSGNGNMVLIYAVKANNLTIEGNGTINGQGAAFYTGQGDGTSPVKSKNSDPNAPQPNRDRPHLMIFYLCDNLKIHDVFLTASAYHCMRILQCTHVNFDGIRIYNRVNKNNDGFHFNSCENVKIANCEVLCQDDACALFGSNKFVTVTNCTFSTRWSIFRFSSGESQNICVSNCLIYDTYGCVVKIEAGNSRIENLTFSNIIMRNVTGPIGIGFTGGNNKTGAKDTATREAFVRNIAFNGIRATVVSQPVNHPDIPFNVSVNNGEQNSCITLNGLGNSYIENISFNDVQVTYAGGGSAELAAKKDIQQYSAEYFGVWNQPPFGPPAYAMYARNVKGLTLNNVRFEVKSPDMRPAIIFDNVIDATLSNLSVQGNPQAETTLRFINSRDVLLSSPRLITPATAFLQVEGADSKGITLDGGDVTKAYKLLIFNNKATKEMIKVRE
ncbi:MAG: glycosyl hydrolase family 28 protein [Bacteroidota bacterium]|nr:glycosyl hydrolase family 28 protein [Bacteroidota bacterium]